MPVSGETPDIKLFWDSEDLITKHSKTPARLSEPSRLQEAEPIPLVLVDE